MGKKVVKNYVRIDKFKYSLDLTLCKCLTCDKDMELTQIQVGRLTHSLTQRPERYSSLLEDYQTCGGCRV